jgi:hypothetical protein
MNAKIWKRAAKSYRNARRYFSESASQFRRERDAYLDNLTTTQARCTELLEEVRRLRGQFAYLESRVEDYPILSVLLKGDKQ